MRFFSLIVIFIFTGSFSQAKPVRSEQIQDAQDWRVKQRFWGETTKAVSKKENNETEEIVVKEREQDKNKEEAALTKNHSA